MIKIILTEEQVRLLIEVLQDRAVEVVHSMLSDDLSTINRDNYGKEYDAVNDMILLISTSK